MKPAVIRGLLVCLFGTLVNGRLLGQEKKDDNPRKPVAFTGQARVNSHPYKMEKGATYRITVVAEGFEPVVMIRSRGQVAGVAGGVNGLARVVFTASRTEEHQLLVDFDAGGKIADVSRPYTLLVERATFAVESKTKEALKLNERTYEMTRGKVYAITVKSKDFAPEVRIALGDKIVAHELSSGFGRRPLKGKPLPDLLTHLTFAPARSAEYRILVARPPSGSPKKKDDPDKADKAALAYSTTITELKIELSVAEKLTRDDPIYQKRGPYKVHEVKLQAGTTYQIDLRSDDFDSFLLLEDSAGKVMESDDDGGGFPHARIIFSPKKTATYRLIATTYKANAAGSYTLTVIENPNARRAPFPGLPGKDAPSDKKTKNKKP